MATLPRAYATLVLSKGLRGSASERRITHFSDTAIQHPALIKGEREGLQLVQRTIAPPLPSWLLLGSRSLVAPEQSEHEPAVTHLKAAFLGTLEAYNRMGALNARSEYAWSALERDTLLVTKSARQRYHITSIPCGWIRCNTVARYIARLVTGTGLS